MSTKSAANGRPAALLAWVAAALALLLVSRPLLAAPDRSVVVLREHGAGAASRAQPYLDELLQVIAKQNEWPKVSGRYFSERAPALEFIRKEKPDFGILSLGAFLALKSSLSLSVLGEVVAPSAGGGQYFLVAKRATKTESCAGRRVATTFASDPKFIDRVVANGAFRLADFTLVSAQRPLEPLKQVLRGDADCALIDDAQLEAAKHIEQGGELGTVWQSAKLPGMVVVAFPRADSASASRFKQSLGGICTKAKQACQSVGIELIRPSNDDRYRPLLAAYSKP